MWVPKGRDYELKVMFSDEIVDDMPFAAVLGSKVGERF